MNKLLILEQNAQEYAGELQNRALPALEIVTSNDANCREDHIRSANIILGQPDLVAGLLHQAEQLEWVQSSFAGIEPFCSPGLRTDYHLTGVKGIFGPLMSEYVFAYILALERHLFQMRENQRHCLWESLPYRSLAGVTIGICGLGSIGQHIARTAAHFQMRVLGLRRSPRTTACVEQVFGPSEVNLFVREVDYLVVVLPSTPQTRHFIDGSVLSHMKESAVLISVGRGATVSENDLARALRAGSLRSAVIDVFESEPLPPASPLWKLGNAYVTPHHSAVTFTKDIVGIFSENYKRFIENKPLKYIIDLKRGY